MNQHHKIAIMKKYMRDFLQFHSEKKDGSRADCKTTIETKKNEESYKIAYNAMSNLQNLYKLVKSLESIPIDKRDNKLHEAIRKTKNDIKYIKENDSIFERIFIYEKMCEEMEKYKDMNLDDIYNMLHEEFVNRYYREPLAGGKKIRKKASKSSKKGGKKARKSRRIKK